ncbi:MAG: hypothetical protein ACI36V_06485 [Coriobacteriales bacterium]
MESEETLCPSCGAPLPELKRPKVEFCNFSGQLCANPCGQRFKRVKSYVNCGNRTKPQ